MREIVSTKDTNSGSPGISGTRLTCANVAQSLWYGYEFSIEEYLATYNYLAREDIVNCLRYCASRKCIADNVHSYCEQCTLDKRPADPELAMRYDVFRRDLPDGETEDVWRLAELLLAKYNAKTTDVDNIDE